MLRYIVESPRIVDANATDIMERDVLQIWKRSKNCKLPERKVTVRPVIVEALSVAKYQTRDLCWII